VRMRSSAWLGATVIVVAMRLLFTNGDGLSHFLLPNARQNLFVG